MKTISEMTIMQYKKVSIAGTIALSICMALSGCGGKSESNKNSQTLVSVDGKEITVHQLNEELARANVQPAQKDAASKQILNALIDRQLLEDAAIKAKVDRDPNVMQAIERAKSQLIAQAYLQGKVSNINKVDKSEVESFYKENPAAYSDRKLVEMEQLLIDSRHIGEEFKSALGGFKTLQEVASWLDAKGIQYDRGEVARSVAELPPQISERLKDARKGQLFVIGMGPRTMLVLMDNVKSSPVTLADASPAIEQIILNKKRKEAGENELKQLRSLAKIEYVDEKFDAGKTSIAKPEPVKEAPKASQSDDIAKGVSGLK